MVHFITDVIYFVMMQFVLVKMKKIIIFAIIMLLLITMVSSEVTITPEEIIKDKLKEYAEDNVKTDIDYKDFTVNSYTTDDKIVTIHVTIDGRSFIWYTSIKNFETITDTKNAR